jgi:hypothetical protein
MNVPSQKNSREHKQSSHATRHGVASGERKYRSYSFLTSTRDGLSGQRHTPAAFWPGEKTPVPIIQEAGWAPEPV